MNIENPIIEKIETTKKSVELFEKTLENQLNKKSDLIRNYPTVYLYTWKKNNKYQLYVGESKNFFKRTEQHFSLSKKSGTWQNALKNTKGDLYIIAHPDFNKSLTLDIENKLIHYLSGVKSVEKIHNAKGNPQNKYFPVEEFEEIFSKTWKQLKNCNKDLFLDTHEIKESVIYKASPLHKLNNEQLKAQEVILDKIVECLLKGDSNQLIFVKGRSGTGKSVLMSSIFYQLVNQQEFTVSESDINIKEIECAILVNHQEQLTVYKDIVKKLDLEKRNKNIVFNPTEFINLFKKKKREKLFDVVFVDEAHLLLTQNNQSFNGNKQLQEILKYSKVVVAMFDNRQIMNAQQYLEKKELKSIINIAKRNHSFIELNEQMRMMANKKIIAWLDTIIDFQKIEPLTKQRNNYEIKIFDSPEELENAIKQKASKKETALSRMVATYDWPYNSKKSPEDSKYWEVTISNWSKPWNREIIKFSSPKDKSAIKGLSWAEQPQTIDEIGSIFTIQGFDLNYVGVIIGPSVKFRDNKIIFDTKKSYNAKAIQKRTLSDGQKKSFGEEFLRNELGVLLTRGVNGLYIYACDDELQKQLKKCVN